MQSIKTLSAVGVHIGNLRENNEDNFYYNGVYLDEKSRDIPVLYAENRESNIQIYAVCDGMGGEESGEIASLIAAKTLSKYQDIFNNINYHDFDKYISMYFFEANDLIYERSKENRIGTTIALLCIEGEYAHIYNIGDSRVYLLRNKKMKQVSEDHTQAVRLVKLGAITQDEVKTHPHRNKLTQYMGISPGEMVIKPHKYEIKAKDGDLFFLCSDGITDMLDDNEIENILKKKITEKAMVNELIKKAMEKGGRDNITAMVLRISSKKSLFGFRK